MNLVQNKNHPSLISLNLHRASFTLIELLVVLALVAILSVVVVMTLNPAELLKQARDSNRLSDLATINTALNLFSTDVIGGFMGTSTVVYVSLPDNSSSTCGSWGLPALPAGYTYSCVTSANLRSTDGTGWIPVNFQRISSNSPISQLPIDPQNTTTTGNYYTYVTGGSWMLTAIPESQKQKAELSTNPHITNYPGAIGMGNNLSLSPLFSSTGLVGYWKFNETSGTVAKDSSGYGNDGNLINSPSWGLGKVGGGIIFDQVGNRYVSIPDAPSLNPTSTFSVAGWFNSSSLAGWNVLFGKETWNAGSGWVMYSDSFNITYYHGGSPISASATNYRTGWHHFVFINSSGAAKIFIDGLLVSSANININNSSVPMHIGARHNNDGTGATDYFFGSVDDVRMYNRALSSSEVSALYNSTK